MALPYHIYGFLHLRFWQILTRHVYGALFRVLSGAIGDAVNSAIPIRFEWQGRGSIHMHLCLWGDFHDHIISLHESGFDAAAYAEP